MIEPPPSQPDRQPPLRREEDEAASPVILVADDNAAGRYALRRHLEREGFVVAEADDGAAALDHVAANHVDLVVLDVNLPDMSGFEVCRRWRADALTRRLPVLQLSATAIDTASQVVGLEAGADAYLVEPVDRAVLVATIRALLRAARAERTAERRASEWQSTFDAIRTPVSLLDPGGRVARVNRAFAELLGRSVRECVGGSFEDSIDPDASRPELRRVAAVRESLAQQVAEGEVRGRWQRLVLDPIVDARGRLDAIAASLTDLEDWRRAEVQLEKALAKERRVSQAAAAVRRLLEAVVEQLPVALIVAEAPSGQVMISNRQVESIWRRSIEDASGLSPFSSWPTFHRDGTPYAEDEQPMVRVLQRGELIHDETIEIERGDGSRAVVSVSAGPVRDESGRIVAGVSAFTDVTARTESEALRDTFISVLSHELRTPITTIYAGTRLLLKETHPLGDAARAEVLEDVGAEAARLERLIENLLVLVRIERGVADAGHEPVLLQRLVDRVVDDERRRWPVARFEVQGPPGLPAISADEAFVELIVRNLLSNAAKYGPIDGEVRIVLEPADREVVMRVLDEGPGIAAGRERDLFRVFYRARETAAVAPGAGIGLFIVRSLAEQMGGRVWAHNRPDASGAEFGLALPVFEE